MLPDRSLLWLIFGHFRIDKEAGEVLCLSFCDYWLLFSLLTAWKVVHFFIFNSLVNEGFLLVHKTSKIAEFFFESSITRWLLLSLIGVFFGFAWNGRKKRGVHFGVLLIKDCGAEFERDLLVMVFDIFVRRENLICGIEFDFDAVQHFLGMCVKLFFELIFILVFIRMVQVRVLNSLLGNWRKRAGTGLHSFIKNNKNIYRTIY